MAMKSLTSKATVGVEQRSAVGNSPGLVLAAVAAVVVLRPWDNPQPRFPTATVAANGAECAAIGRDILAKGGSAADAAIATLLCDGVSCSQCMGLGGGFIMTVYDSKTRTVQCLDARERAPAAITKELYQNASPAIGGLSIAIPTELKGMGELYRRYGKLPWADLVRPAADLCKKGHRVSNYLARTLIANRDVIKNEPSLREVFVSKETGDVYEEGDVLLRPKLGATLDVIAQEGPDALHSGSLTERFVKDIRQIGGVVTIDDMKNYKPTWQEPIKVNLTQDYTLYATPVPGSGSILAFILNMLDGWVDTAEAPANSPLYYHRIVEAFKYGYAKRTGLGEPPRPYLHFSLEQLIANLSNPEFAKSHRRLVDDHSTSNDWQHYGAMFDPVDDHGTGHVSVIAPDGSAVGITSTINYFYGSKRLSLSTGIVLNDEIDDFAVPDHTSNYGMPPSPANMVEAGKAPLSSMTPVIVLERGNTKPKMVIGAAGGTKITTQVALVLRKTLFEGVDFGTAMVEPRIHHQLLPMEIQYESDFDSSVLRQLQRKGHAVSELAPTSGFAAVVGAIREDTGDYLPQVDKRRLGSVAGF